MSISLRTSSVVALASLAVSAGVALPAAAAPRPPGPATVADAGAGKGTPTATASPTTSSRRSPTPGRASGWASSSRGRPRDAARRAAPSLEVDRATAPSRGSRARSPRAGAGAGRVPGVTRVELNGVARALDASGDLDYGVTAAAHRRRGDGHDARRQRGRHLHHRHRHRPEPRAARRARRRLEGLGQRDAGPPYDDHGHGTHVAGIAAGRPVGSADTRRTAASPPVPRWCGARCWTARVRCGRRRGRRRSSGAPRAATST